MVKKIYLVSYYYDSFLTQTLLNKLVSSQAAQSLFFEGKTVMLTWDLLKDTLLWTEEEEKA